MICPTCQHGQDPAAVGETCSACGAGLLIEGRYRLEAEVGRGALGAVYRARDLEEDREVAVKAMVVVHPDAKRVERAAREVMVLEQLRHPAVPRYLDHVTAGRQLFLVQELVPGRTLRDELSEHRFDQDEVLGVLAGVLDTLAWLHKRSPPVIHRDIKPGNVMRKPDGSTALLDFGSVRDALADPDLGGSTVAGTFGYMAPEQFRGDASPATDIYGAGAMAVELLSRRNPAQLMDYAGRLKWQGTVDVHDAVGQLLAEMLAPDPAKRPQDAAALRDRILALRDGLAHGTLPAVRTAPRKRDWGRSVAFIFAATVIGVSVMTLGAVAWVATSQVDEMKARSGYVAPTPAEYGDTVVDPYTSNSFVVLREDVVAQHTEENLRSLADRAMHAAAETGEWPKSLGGLNWEPTLPASDYAIWWLDENGKDQVHAVLMKGPGQGRHWVADRSGTLVEGTRMTRNDILNRVAVADWVGQNSEWWPDVD